MRALFTSNRRLIRESSLARSSLALITGTISSQAIVFLLSPILSRIFAPADFGDFANYTAWVTFLGLLSNFRYEHAIIVAKGRLGTNRVMALATSLTLASAFAYAIGASLVYLFYSDSGYLNAIRGVILFIPLGVVSAFLPSVLTMYNTRAGKFRRLATVAVVQVVCTTLSQIVFGLLHFEHGLLLGAITGNTLSGVVLLFWFLRTNSWRHVRREMALPQLKLTATEHMNFPRYSLGADAINVVVQQFVPVLLMAMFNPAIAGLYAFATRVVRVPFLIVSSAVSTVLRKQAADHLRREGSLRSLFNATLTSLSVLAVVPLLVFGLFAGPLFVTVFGDKWREAGRVVQILSPGIALEFIAFPLTVLFVITGTQRYSFRLQLIGFGLLLSALMIGRYLVAGFIATCYLMSAAMVALNVATIVVASRVANRRVPLRADSKTQDRALGEGHE